jgi:hypothetical protein
MEDADSSTSAELSRVAVRVLPFWAEQAAVWFTQAEAQFFLPSICSEINYCHTISQLDHR